jgi:hypothetical protein
MKIATALAAVSFGAALAAGCGGSTVGDNVGPSDAGPTGPSSRGIEGGTAPADASMTGAAPPAFNVSCESARTCPAPQICCATVSLGGATAGLDVACANTCGLLGFQVCASSAECTTSGDVCSPSPLGIGSICAPPARDAEAVVIVDSGVTGEAGAAEAGTSKDAGALDAGTLVDAGALDAGTLADAAPIGADAAPVDAAAPLDAEAADGGALDAALGDTGPGDDSGDIDSGDVDSGDIDAAVP